MNAYNVANAKLTGRCQNSRKVANNTYLQRRGEDIALKLHQTDVVTLHPDGSITLNSGGWHTVTTKARISDYYQGLHSAKGVWYLRDGSLFYDGVTIHAYGLTVH